LYDPVLKRFLDTDPAGQGFSPYAYALNNPVMYIDPTGMSIDQWFRDLFNGIVMGFGIMTDFVSDTFGLYPQYYHEEILVTANRPENINSDSFYPERKVFYLDDNYNLPSQDRVSHVNSFDPIDVEFSYGLTPDVEQKQIENATVRDKEIDVSIDNNYNIIKAVKYLNAEAYPKYVRGKCGKCAKAVRLAVENGGIIIQIPEPTVYPYKYGSAKDYGPSLLRAGFNEIKKEDYDPKMGDIRVFQPYKGGSPHGHMNMYNGDKWVSDYFETDFWPGPGYRKLKPKFNIYRWNK